MTDKIEGEEKIKAGPAIPFSHVALSIQLPHERPEPHGFVMVLGRAELLRVLKELRARVISMDVEAVRLSVTGNSVQIHSAARRQNG